MVRAWGGGVGYMRMIALGGSVLLVDGATCSNCLRETVWRFDVS